MRFGLRELIFLVVLLSVPVASFVFVFKPRNDEIRQASKEVELKTAKLEMLNQVNSRIDNLSEAIEEWREAVEVIESKLPDRQEIDKILKQVWNLTTANKLEIISTETEPAVQAAAYMEQPLRIKIRGNFDGFYQFLLDLEDLKRITRIHQLHILRAGSRSKAKRSGKVLNTEDLPEGSMEAEFVLSIYYESSDQMKSGI